MKQHSKQIQQKSDYNAMETETIQKNRVSREIQLIGGILIICGLISILFSSCGTRLLEVQVDRGFTVLKDSLPTEREKLHTTMVEFGGRTPIERDVAKEANTSIASVNWRLGYGMNTPYANDTITSYKSLPTVLALAEWQWDLSRTRFAPYLSMGFGYMYLEETSSLVLKPSFGLRYFVTRKFGVFANASCIGGLRFKDGGNMFYSIIPSVGISYQIIK